MYRCIYKIRIIFLFARWSPSNCVVQFRRKFFTNSENLLKQKEAGVARKLVGFELIERGIPRHDYEIVDADGNNIGIVTSGTMAPSLGKGIGMGYVPTAFSAVDSEIFIRIRKNDVPAKVIKLPFYKK